MTVKDIEGSQATQQHEGVQDDDELLVDTSKMSEGQAEALEVAESARQKEWKQPSFGSQLFMGTFAPDMLFPFPEQSVEDKKIGDKFIAELGPYLKEHLDADAVDETRTIPQNVIDKLFEMGAFAMKIPQKYGGLGFSQVNYNRVIQLVSSHCGATAVLLSAHQSIGVPQPLLMYGTEEQKQRWLPRFRKDAISAFALTEPNVGSDPAQMSSTADMSEDGTHYILNGEKLWCTNGAVADIMVVMCRTKPKIVNGKERQQITALIVEKNMPGVEVVHRCDFMGIRGIQNALLRFTNVKVPKDNLLWKEGRGLALALGTLNVGRLTVPAACIGMSRQALSVCRRFGRDRVQWGQPIGLHEPGRQKLAFIASTTQAIEAVTWLTSHWADQKKNDIRIEAAMAKLFCTENAWRIADMTVQMRGGRGYEKASSLQARGEEPFPVERMMRDSRINLIIEGTSEIMRLFLAREALDPHLNLAAGLLKKNSSMGTKISTLFKMMGFYAMWYPKQWINGSSFSSYPKFGKLSQQMKFVEKTSHKLARTLFHYMARYQDALERKQLILGNLTDIATELFAMSATCSYAVMQAKQRGNDEPLDLAAHFCWLAKRRIEGHFRSLKQTEETSANPIGKKIINGDYRWMEEDIVWVGDNS
ncbi:MAG: DNA polymerase II [Waddliaceae bacterium]|nr:DNA polymerase II [Waddliaceae bacterium]